MAPGRRRPLLLNQTDFRLLQFSKLSRRYIVRGHHGVRKILKDHFHARFYIFFYTIITVNFFHKNAEKTEKCVCVLQSEWFQFCEFKVSSGGKSTKKAHITSWPIKIAELRPLCKIDAHYLTGRPGARNLWPHYVKWKFLTFCGLTGSNTYP